MRKSKKIDLGWKFGTQIYLLLGGLGCCFLANTYETSIVLSFYCLTLIFNKLKLHFTEISRVVEK